jgi:hypothetical protein
MDGWMDGWMDGIKYQHTICKYTYKIIKLKIVFTNPCNLMVKKINVACDVLSVFRLLTDFVCLYSYEF